MQIGRQHGRQAKDQIHSCIAFYVDFLGKKTGKDQAQLQSLASDFIPFLAKNFPAYLDEIKGVAEAAEADELDVLMLNVRTELAFGVPGDGCTALSWKTSSGAFIAQNWDVSFPFPYRFPTNP